MIGICFVICHLCFVIEYCFVICHSNFVILVIQTIKLSYCIYQGSYEMR